MVEDVGDAAVVHTTKAKLEYEASLAAAAPDQGLSSKAQEAKRAGSTIGVANTSDEAALQYAFEREVKGRMREALDVGEFVIYLQPKLDLHKDKVVGAEALVRWRDPRIGLRLPGAFVPLCEKNGFIVDLDRFVFEQVCALLHAWSVAGVRCVPLSVNLSRASLLDPAFLQKFEHIRELYGVSPSFLEFELAEKFVAECPDVLSRIIEALHHKGYSCSFDGFGQGWGSLATLEQFGVDAVKLDRAFFGGPYVEAGRDLSIIVDIVNLARKLRMKTVAEGVESEDQRAFVVDMGCDILQGYLFSKPLSVADFERLLFGSEVAATPSRTA